MAGLTVSDPISAGIGLLTDVIDKIFPNQVDRDKAKLALLQQAQAGDLAQLQVNAAEAANPNWFVAGGRPFIIWVCGFAFAYDTIVQPLLSWWSLRNHGVIPPAVDSTVLMPVMLGLLGLGGMRTFEKVHGVQGNH